MRDWFKKRKVILKEKSKQLGSYLKERFIKYRIQIIKGLILIAISAFNGFLFLKFPAPADRILNIQNYLITVGGIISAFVIAYLAGKIFNLRAERENRQIEINKLSEKLTNYRRILFYTIKSRDFWVYYEHISEFKKKYPGLNYERLHNQSGEDKMSMDFWLNEEKLSSSTVDLYCAMEAIYGDPETIGFQIPWAHDKSISFNYSLNDLAQYYDPSNQIWYYLEGRFAKHGKGRFNDTGINRLYENDFINALPKIDLAYKGKEFHRELLADISAEFYSLYLPKLYELTQKNIGIPKSLKVTFYSLLSIMIFGVIMPIILQSLLVPDNLNVTLTLVLVWCTIISILNFLFDFFTFLEEDVHIVKNSR